jgi:hypothetical protein
MTCPRFPNVFERCLRSIRLALDMRGHLTFLWAGSYIFARTHCCFFPQLMSRILKVRYEKHSLIAHCLLGYFFCTFAKIIHHPCYSEPCFFLVFYCALNWDCATFFLNQSFDGMGSTNTHDTCLSAEGERLASCIQIMDCFAVRGDDLGELFGSHSTENVHSNYFNRISTRNSPPPARSHVIIPPPRGFGRG